MNPIFEIGDFIQHKDVEKRETMELKGKILNICKSDNGTEYYLVQYNGIYAVLMENQDEYEKINHS